MEFVKALPGGSGKVALISLIHGLGKAGSILILAQSEDENLGQNCKPLH